MHLDWSAVFTYAVSGAIVSWPVFIAGLWIGHRKALKHVDNVTGKQTARVQQITDAQTSVLLGQLEPGYQKHGTRQGPPEGQDGGDPEDPQHQPQGPPGDQGRAPGA